jgi:hypothetical protein
MSTSVRRDFTSHYSFVSLPPSLCACLSAQTLALIQNYLFHQAGFPAWQALTCVLCSFKPMGSPREAMIASTGSEKIAREPLCDP